MITFTIRETDNKSIMEYIVRGSKNENDNKFKLTLERVCCIWVKSQTT